MRKDCQSRMRFMLINMRPMLPSTVTGSRVSATGPEPCREQIQGEPVVIFHEAYAYVAQEYGLEVVGSMDLDEERQVSAGEVAEILNVIEQYQVPVVLAEKLYGESMGKTIEAESDAQVIYLDPITRGEYEKDSYLDAMENNMELLENAFEQHSHEGHDHG